MELKNSEHYNDPTPYEAHKNIRKEEQLEAARMSWCYVAEVEEEEAE